MNAQTEYCFDGVSLNTARNELWIDLTQPRAIVVKGVNERTGETKIYMLRVTNAGRLILN